MRISRTIICLLLCNFISAGAWAQQVKSVLPYKLVGGKMIVDFNVGGKALPFIFDTGAHTMIIEELAQELGLTAAGSIKVRDVNSSDGNYPVATLDRISTFDDAIGFRNVPVLLIPGETFGCFNAVGLIGSELFGNMIVSIDARTRTITVTSAEKAATASLRRMTDFLSDGTLPLISAQVGETSGMAVLFDTGYSGFISLKNSDYELLKETCLLEPVSQGYGASSIGIGGLEEAKVVYRIDIPLMQVGSVKFRNVRAQTAEPPYTLLGLELLDYGTVTIDYSRRRFYFEPYAADHDLSRVQNNIEMTVRDGDLLISTVWGGMKGVVEAGDKVIKINGKPVRKFDFCDSIINGIPELKAKKRTKLTVQTARGTKTVEISKE